MKKFTLMMLMVMSIGSSVFGMDPSMMTQLPVEMQMTMVSAILDEVRARHSVSLFNFQNDEQKLEALYQEAISEVTKNPMAVAQIATLGKEIPKTLTEAEALVRAEIKKQDTNASETQINAGIDLGKKAVLTMYDLMRPSYFSMSQSYAIVTTAAALAVFAAYKYVYPSKKSRLNDTQN